MLKRHGRGPGGARTQPLGIPPFGGFPWLLWECWADAERPSCLIWLGIATSAPCEGQSCPGRTALVMGTQGPDGGIGG